MIFISNKYYNIYYNIINKAISRNFRSRKEAKKILGYVEQHHVLPRSLGGDDSRNNTVYLTAREHFICHLLLVRMTTYPEKRSMIFALQNFIHRKKDKLNDYKINSHRYALLRELASKEMSKLHKGKTSWNKGLKQDEKSNKKRSLSLKGKTHTEEHRRKNSEARIGTKRKYSDIGIENIVSAAAARRGVRLTKEQLQSRIGNVWWNNGEIETRSKTSPGKNYVRGRL